MTYDNCLHRARSFWRAFEHFEHAPETAELFDTRTEQYRFRCLLGFTAIDSLMVAYWQQVILPDWDSILSLAESTLADPEALSTLAHACGSSLSRGQLVATLSFLANTGDPARFSPSFVDVGVLALLLAGLRFSSVAPACSILFRVQRMRNACAHTGREFNELMGRESVEMMADFFARGSAISPIFDKRRLLEEGLEAEAA